MKGNTRTAPRFNHLPAVSVEVRDAGTALKAVQMLHAIAIEITLPIDADLETVVSRFAEARAAAYAKLDDLCARELRKKMEESH